MAHQKDPEDWVIKRRRDGRKHIDACGSGYTGASTRYMQVHHLLPVTSLADGTIAKQLKNNAPKITIVRNCLMITDWDINAAHNVIALPRKAAFIRKRAPGGWDKLPRHEVDHPKYTKEVCDDLRGQVWEPVNRSAKEWGKVQQPAASRSTSCSKKSRRPAFHEEGAAEKAR